MDLAVGHSLLLVMYVPHIRWACGIFQSLLVLFVPVEVYVVAVVVGGGGDGAWDFFYKLNRDATETLSSNDQFCGV